MLLEQLGQRRVAACDHDAALPSLGDQVGERARARVTHDRDAVRIGGERLAEVVEHLLGQPDIPLAIGDSWSAQARILPFIEQTTLQDKIDYGLSYAVQGAITQSARGGLSMPQRGQESLASRRRNHHYPLSYAFNCGTWFVYDPTTQTAGNGALCVNVPVTPASFADGTSTTLLAAEVKQWTPYLRDGGTPNGMGVPPPATQADAAAFGGSFKADSGHTEWVDGRAHQTGFTSTFTPNARVPFTSGGIEYDIDFTSSREGKTTNRTTYAAVASRSYHPTGVMVVLMDDSTRLISSTIELDVWRALDPRRPRSRDCPAVGERR